MQLRGAVRSLVVGCGNSPVSEHMYQDGFTNLVSIDYSSVVIAKMKQQTPFLDFQEMDCQRMTFKDEEFDFILDKGTLDAILCGTDSKKNGESMIAEVYRVLKTGGVFVVVTYGKADTRMSYLQKIKFSWKITQHTLPAQNTSQFMYVMRKVPHTGTKGSLG